MGEQAGVGLVTSSKWWRHETHGQGGMTSDMPNKRDDSWFYEISGRFFTSLWWATIIILFGSIVAYLTFQFL
jgi:hypothetical protein